MKAIVAIDPGVTGAIAVDSGTGELYVEDIPTFKVKTGKKVRTHYLLADLAEILRAIIEPATFVIIEKVGARPTDGAVQAFSFGRGFGILEGMCTALGATVIYVAPNKWKKEMSLNQDKRYSVERANKAFPELSDRLKLVKDNGRAEALLLLQYAKEHVL